jgi:hypothetical protein
MYAAGMSTRSDGINDPRWVVLGEDGRFVTLGRARDPSEEDIVRAEDGLRSRGLSGWLAIMSGSIHARRLPTLLMVRPLAAPKGSFDAAVEAFTAARTQSV